jgi:CHASE2 domain-containing sensor protein
MGGLSRRQREKRAYTLTLVTGGAAVATVVLFVVGVIGVIGLAPAFLALVVAAIAGFMLRSTLRP